MKKSIFRLLAVIPVAALPPDEMQIVEILKAISFDPKILILDEATASLDSRQVQRLFELIRQWKTEDKAIVFVSHRMEEIFQIADRYSVLRNGKTVDAGIMKEISEKELVNRMVGKDSVYGYSRPEQQKRLEVQKPIRLAAEKLQTKVLRGVDLSIHEGELLGLGGLKGQGQRDLLLSLFGDLPHDGKVILSGKEVSFSHPRHAINNGIALVPGDRSREGLLAIRSILENLMLPSWKNYDFALRRELVNTLGAESGIDIPGQVAGAAMNSPIPMGLAGTGPAMVGSATLAHFLSPAFWPVLFASSPRLSAEFLRLYGKGMMETPGMQEAATRFMAFLAAKNISKE